MAELIRELAEARDTAQAHQESYEAANEELQASNEEVQSANEELQSTNEELETSKEELESINEEVTSVNEELRTVNDDVATRNSELNRLNSDLNNLLIGINTGIMLLTRELVIRSFSPAAGKIFGLVATDVGYPLGRIRHPFQGPDLEKLLRECIETVSLRETEIQDEGGRWYGLRMRPYMTVDNRIDGAVLVMTDIDRQMEALRVSEMRYRRLFETAKDGILILDAATGVITDANAFAGELLDQTREELIGAELWSTGLLREKKAWTEMLGHLRQEGFIRHDDLTVARRGNERRHVEMVSNLYKEGDLTAIQCNLRDITQRHTMETAMRESEQRFRMIADAAPVLIWLAGLSNGCYYFNKAWLDFVGRPLESERENGWAANVHPDDLERCLGVRTASFDTQQPFELEYRLRHQSGEYRWLLDRGVPRISDDGRFEGFIGACVDIQKQKEAEEAIRTARDATLSASQAKDRFLAALSHELRTPLTPVLILVSELEECPDLAPEVRENFAMIRKNVQLEARLLDDLLDLTRITRGKLHLRMHVLDARLLIDHVLTILNSEAQAKSIAMKLDLAAPVHQVNGDEVRLQQVFWNVLKNAVKFTPANGSITIRTRNEGGQLSIAVEDTGLGITEEEMPRIFDAFSQGDEAASPRFGGLGLGLSIASLLMREHGGRIWAESLGRGDGSTFYIELPLAAQQGAEKAPANVTSKTKNLNILLVEDHEATRTTITRLLTRRGHQVAAGASLGEARALAAGASFDLVISDLGLPDGSGHDLMRELQREYGLPGIALSGYGMSEDIQHSLDAGFRDHLIKPVDVGALDRAMRGVAAYGEG